MTGTVNSEDKFEQAERAPKCEGGRLVGILIGAAAFGPALRWWLR